MFFNFFYVAVSDPPFFSQVLLTPATFCFFKQVQVTVAF